MPDVVISSIITENTFWLQIMGDHARFIMNGLSPLESAEIEKARSYITLFDGLLARSRVANLTPEQITQINQEGYKAAQDILAFLLHVLSRQLTGGIALALMPEIITHFIRETDEYINLLQYFNQNKTILIHPLHLHIVWLNNFTGHSIFIQDTISYSYREIRQKADAYEQDMAALFFRALEINDFLRTGLQEFPAMTQLTTDIVNTVKQFENFFTDLELHIIDKKVLGSLTVLMLDHMFRELCYYVTKLKQVSNIQIETCDPGRPRKE